MISETVSVVIPTFGRHEVVQRAVESALVQTHQPIEVIVVNDGPDPKKRAIFDKLLNSSIKYVEAPARKSASATRNYGISIASADWIALLDDDDIWLPNKLMDQFLEMKERGLSEAILAGVERVLFDGNELHLRPKFPIPKRITADKLLFCGYGGVHTSTLMAPRHIFKENIFDEALERHEDWNWILRVGSKLPVVVSPNIVCERHLAPGEGLSQPGGFEYSQFWYYKNREYMCDFARAAFVSSILSSKAAYDLKIFSIPFLLNEIFQCSGLNIRNMLRMIMPWLVPSAVRRFIRRII